MVYAITLKWPTNHMLCLGSVRSTSQTKVTILGYPGSLHITQMAGIGLKIDLPDIPFNKMPCDWAWVFKVENVAN